jgi:signal peptidase I
MLTEVSRLKKSWERLTEGWAGSIIYIILGFAIALAANAALGVALHTDTPVVAVFSDSMVPTYLCGDMIFVVGDHNASIGDVIVFDAPGYAYPIIHRVVQKTDGNFQTKGDHNSVIDPWITPPDAIHGKAALRVPLLGWVKKLYVGMLNGGNGLRCD